MWSAECEPHWRKLGIVVCFPFGPSLHTVSLQAFKRIPGICSIHFCSFVDTRADKPLKQFGCPCRAYITPLKQGVNESTRKTTGLNLEELFQILICALNITLDLKFAMERKYCRHEPPKIPPIERRGHGRRDGRH